MMMNFQKYSAELEDIMSNHEMVGLFRETGKLKPCDEMSCRECEFEEHSFPESDGCAYGLVDWLFREARE